MKRKHTLNVVMIVTILLAVILSTDGGSVYAQVGKRLPNYVTGRCLDSNTDQDVYTLGCNGGYFQRWEIRRHRGDNTVTLRNVSTRYCLDSNTDKEVYTHDCNFESFQRWYYTALKGHGAILKNKATGFCLTVNIFGRGVSTGKCDRASDFQRWHVYDD